jgi:hypothetical protein
VTRAGDPCEHDVHFQVSTSSNPFAGGANPALLNLPMEEIAPYQPELYFVKVSVDRTLRQISPNAEPDGLEIVSTSVSLSGT